MAKQIRWGIIGCGDVTEIKSGPGFQQASGSELIAVMRRDVEFARDYASRHRVPIVHSDGQELINDENVDAVYIATPPDSHMRYALDVIAAGKPVYVEKPMATSYDQCRKMVDAAKKADIPLFVAYYRRALPRFLKINMLLHRGEIGKIQGVSIRHFQKTNQKDLNGVQHWRVDPKIAGCGYFCDLGSHAIDLIQYFLGEIVEVSGFSSNQERLYSAEDNVAGTFKFKNGILGSSFYRFNASEDLDEVEIYGSEGKITYSTFANIPVKLIKKGRLKEFVIDHPPHIQQPLIQTIVDQLSGKGKCPSTGVTAARTNWVIDKILNRI